MAKKERPDWAAGPEGAAPGGDAPRGGRIGFWALHILVFVCGGALMGVEIVGGRVLSPYFGSSVFVWGAIIGVFMAALAMGYYLGGMVADRRPSLGWLAAVVGIAGALVMVLTKLATPACGWVDRMDLGPRYGPLVAALALYFPPSLFLGAVSPFAVRLQARSLSAMGNVAGRLYALSTAGSLLGTLGTTFWLIPTLSTSKILFILGVVLMAVAVMAMAAHFAVHGGPKTRGASAMTILFLTGPFVLGYFFSPAGLPGAIPSTSAVTVVQRSLWWSYVVEERESPYHTIAVVRGFSPLAVVQSGPQGAGMLKPHLSKLSGGEDLAGWLGKETRDLSSVRLPQNVLEAACRLDPDAVQEVRFNNLVESSLYLNRPNRPPATTYTQILHLGMAFRPEARKIMVMGLGGGSVPREFSDNYPGVQIDVAEIDPAVLEVARRDFFFADSENGPYRVYVEDGRQFVRRGHGRAGEYDLIILDAYSGGGQIPAHLVTEEFLTEVRGRLAPDGILVSNIISPMEGRMSRFFRAECRTMRKLFEHVYIFPGSHDWSREGRDWREDTRNLILVATRDKAPALGLDDIVALAEELTARHPGLKDLNLAAHARRYQPLGGPEEYADVPVLTDAYAPVETMFWYQPDRGRRRG